MPVKILIGVVGLVVLLLLIALFVKKDYALERTITIYQPKEKVFQYIKFLKNQDHYSKWVMTDPGMKKDFRGTDGTEGFVYAWDSNNKNAGKGEQEIKKITEGERLDIEVRFEKPFAGIAYTPITTEATAANSTRVIWGMQGRSAYPLNLMNIFMDKILGGDLEKSLATLKSILEKQ